MKAVKADLPQGTPVFAFNFAVASRERRESGGKHASCKSGVFTTEAPFDPSTTLGTGRLRAGRGPQFASHSLRRRLEEGFKLEEGTVPMKAARAASRPLVYDSLKTSFDAFHLLRTMSLSNGKDSKERRDSGGKSWAQNGDKKSVNR